MMAGIGFALPAPIKGSPSLIEQYREAAGKLPRADRTVLDAWQKSWFAVCEIIERSASQELDPGDWIACFLMPVSGGVELEGTCMPLAATTRIAAVQAFLKGVTESGLEPTQVDPATSRDLGRAVIHAVRRQQRKPLILNYDRDPVELITATLDLAWPDVIRATGSWDDAVDAGDAVNLLG
jgi:hypothetical protein